MDVPDRDEALHADIPPRIDRPAVAVFVVEGRLTRDDIPDLCRRARAIIDATPVDVVVCDVAGIVRPDGVTLDALARLQLAARRRGCRVALRGAAPELLALLALSGLTDIVPVEP